MQSYTRRTDGSYIEVKSVGLVWHYADADPEFGIWQAKEMQQHLREVLRGTEVEVITGFGWLQVRYRAINKGTMVSRILGSMLQEPSFVLCVGDDRTDEDMFSYLGTRAGTILVVQVEPLAYSWFSLFAFLLQMTI